MSASVVRDVESRTGAAPRGSAPPPRGATDVTADLAYQDAILQDVSRTFALTIPQLPAGLREPVGNAYLLCRIADTIEDEPSLDAEAKQGFAEEFIAVVAGDRSADTFAESLHPLLSGRTLDSEKELVYKASRVIRVTESFRDSQRKAMLRCVRIMSRGMAEFQHNKTLNGLDDLPQLDRYCYHVAGVVGEMLTDLFCDYSAEIAGRSEELHRLAVSFGQGLQMTNILKDVWEDRRRGACWLPRDVFARCGFDLADLDPDRSDPAFRQGLLELVAIARGHLANALRYTLIIPPHERGIRRFCLWALGMAVLTLRKLRGRLDYRSGQDVKISRNSVRATVLVSNALVAQDAALRMLFEMLTKRLPPPQRVDVVSV